MNIIDNLKSKPFFVKKGWGYELIIENNDNYCGKILRFEPGKKFSLHYHLLKEETWLVTFGEFKLTLIDTANGTKHISFFKKDDVIKINKGMPHQLECISLGSGEIFEISTTHYDSDSYRIEKGD